MGEFEIKGIITGRNSGVDGLCAVTKIFLPHGFMVYNETCF